MGFIIFLIILLDFIAILRVINDEVVLFDKEKPKYIILAILLPIIGAFIAIRKTSNSLKLRDKDLQDTPKLTQYRDVSNFKLDTFIDLLD